MTKTKKNPKEPPFTLEQTWKYCLQMWRWIAKQVKAGNEKHSDELKKQWLKENGFNYRQIFLECFFCDWVERRGGDAPFGCFGCPARLVSRKFKCEHYKAYGWAEKPVAFYNKLVELNKKRKKK